MAILTLRDASYAYKVGELFVPVLRGVNLDIGEGEFLAIQGPSGSGKSTLLYLLGGLLKLQNGTLVIEDHDLGTMSGDALCRFRNERVGFVFQQFHLLPRASVLENIMMPVRYPTEIALTKDDWARHEARAREIAVLLGIDDRLDHHPNQLSGGQQQRVAIARALIKDPSIIFADEPTGNLDSVSAAQLLGVFQKLNKEGRTIILITHDAEVAAKAGRVLHIRDGKFEGQLESTAGGGVGRSYETKRSASSMGFWGRLHLIRRLLPDVFRNFGRSRMRTALTMLGIVIGISAVVSLVTLGEFTKRRILDSYEELGVNTVLFSGRPNWFQKATDIEGAPFYQFDWGKDIEPLRKIFPEILRISPVVSDWRVSAFYGGRSVENEIDTLGVNQEAYQMVPGRVIRGRQIVDLDVEGKSPVCVIGKEVVSRLFRNEDPLGKVLFLSSGESRYPCKVIGLLQERSSNNPRRNPNLEVHLPYTYLMLNAKNRWSGRLDNVMVQVDPDRSLEDVAKGMSAYFKTKYGSFGRFNANTDTILVAQMRKFLGLFTLLLASVALVCLTVGGIGITNMMLVSVTERYREIGLRKALGATNRSIRMQFLLESLVICALAGIIGIALGVALYEGAIFAAAKFAPQVEFAWIFDTGAMLLAVVSIFCVGVLSGLFPAIKAERLQVIEALRAE